MLKLKSPTFPYYLNQGFLENGNTYYAEQGLTGHPALDLACGYRQNIMASIDSEVYSILNKDNPDLMKYRAVYTVFKIDGVWYELCYGHLTDILVKKGDMLTVGQVIGTGGNTGDVSSGGAKVTAEEKNAGSPRGTHLHWQLRPLVLVEWDGVSPFYQATGGKVPLYDGSGFIMKEGKYLAIENYYNGVSGCIDPTPYLDVPQPKYQFIRNLYVGYRGDDVIKLQEFLIKEGYYIPAGPTGYFGGQTKTALASYQSDHNIIPALGNFGPLTKQYINSILSM